MQQHVDRAELERLYRDHVARLQKETAALLERTGRDGLVVHSGTPKIRSVFDDQYWPLRPTPHFQHWLPLATARSALLVRPGAKPKLLYVSAFDFWEAPAKPETDHFWSSFDVVELTGAEQVKERLAEVPGGRRFAFVGEDRDDAAAWGFAPADVNPKEVLEGLDALRVTKTPYEMLCLREANRRAALGHARVLAAFGDGDHSELALHCMYLEATGQDDHETPYKNIVALGEHAATLHHVNYAKRREGAQSLLLDAGATYQGYASDVTRTAVKGEGAAAQAFGALIDGVEALQLEMCRQVAAGVPYEDLHNRSHELLAPVLREVGIARGSDAELVGTGITRRFLPHGLGHSLGVQTHDVGCARVRPEPRNPFLRNTTRVAPGQCFTIEPGCYFIRPLLDPLRATPEGALVDWGLVDQLACFGGVRIEDDLAVQDAGAANLTRAYLGSADVSSA